MKPLNTDTAIHTVKLPDIGEGVVEGEVIEWLKAEGEPVGQDEPIVIVMTDKATVELPAPYPGQVAKHHHKVGEMARRDLPLYDLKVDPSLLPDEVKSSKHTATRKKKSTKKTGSTSAAGKKALATPVVRKLAKELGIDINTVTGSGDKGRVTREDLLKQSHPVPTLAKPTTPPLHLDDDESVPLVGIRRLTAERMAESKQMAPHFSYFDQANAEKLIQLRQRIIPEAAQEQIKLTYMPFFIRALSLVIEKYPYVNASVDTEKKELLVHKHHHIGIAISSQNGLVVPVIRDVQDMGIADLIRAFDKLKKDAAAGTIPPKEMVGSTITISNFGTLGGGGVYATPIINYPEVAILAINRIRPQPVVKKREVVVQDTLNLSWSFDHRVIDGDLAAAVSHEFRMLVENPSRLL